MHHQALVTLFAALVAHANAGGLNVPLPPQNIFDYVVIGGGPAGLTVANRLTENPAITVLVLEAGFDDHYEQNIMVPAFQGTAGSVNGQCGGYNWCDQTVPQTYLNGQSRTIPQGYGLGGGTLINAMLWNRGDQGDYNDWVTLGNRGWGWADLLPYFQRSETFNPETNVQVANQYGIGYNPAYHGLTGPQQVAFPNFLYNASAAYSAGMNSMGIPTVLDPNDGLQKGFQFLPQGINARNQSRADARRARFDPVRTRPNLYVSTRQHVHRLLFEGGCGAGPAAGQRAVAMTVSASSTSYTWVAIAKREVIIAAGAIRSPAMLEISGIGSTAALRAAGVKQRINLPGVGNNLQDHMLMRLNQAFNNPDYIYPNIFTNATFNAAASQLYYSSRQGPYTNGPPDGNAFLALPQFSKRAGAIADQAARQTDAQYLAGGLDPTVVAGYARMRPLLIAALRRTDRAAIEFLQNNRGGTQLSNMRPLTRGSTHIVNNDPFVYPRLDMRYGSNPVDLEVMLDSLRFNDALFQTPALQRLRPQQNIPVHNPDDGYFRNFMALFLGTEYHPAGTAAMLPRNLGGVVDTNLLVYGTTNVRVVDASIHPMIPATHMESVVYAVAEKAADIIKAAQPNQPAVMPHMPLDQTLCTQPRSKKRRGEPEDVIRRRDDATTPPVLDTPSPIYAGDYPILASLIPQPTAAVPKAASEGKPTGVAAAFVKDFVNTVEDTAGPVVGAAAALVAGRYDSAPAKASLSAASASSSSTSAANARSSSTSSAQAAPSGYRYNAMRS